MTDEARITRGQFIGGSAALLAAAVVGAGPVRATDAAAFLEGEGFPYDLFDTLKTTDLAVGGGTIHVGFAPGRFTLPKSVIIDRVRMAAYAVTTYYGRFPLKSTRFLIVPVEGEGILGGTTWGYAGGASRILFGIDTTADELKRDWVMTHEMVHLALPDMSYRYLWLAEGLAVYVEPIARVEAGEMPAVDIWSDMKRDMPKGEPRSGDAGLDFTPTWGRTYWGGALYCLLCDIRIRAATDNRLGLQTAMRGVLDAGGNHEVDWPIRKILATADKAVGLTVMMDLYDEMRDKPMHVDLGKIWRDLGVDGTPGTITLQGDAPQASLRIAITQRPTT